MLTGRRLQLIRGRQVFILFISLSFQPISNYLLASQVVSAKQNFFG